MIAIANKVVNPLSEFKERFNAYRCSEIMCPFLDDKGHTLFCNIVINGTDVVLRVYLKIMMHLDNRFTVQVASGAVPLYYKNCTKEETLEHIDHFMETVDNIASKIGVLEFCRYWENLGAVEKL